VRRSVAVALLGVCVAGSVLSAQSARAGGDDVPTANVAAPTLAAPGLPGGAVAPQPAPVPPAGRVLVLGDSIPHSFGSTLAEVAADHGVALHNGAVSGCSLIDGITMSRDGRHFPWSVGCASGIARYEQSIIADYQPDVVVWMSAWETSNRAFDDGSLVRPGTRGGNLRLLAEIDEAAGRLRAGGARLVLVLLAPLPPAFAELTNETTYDRVPYLNAMLEDHARRHADGVSVVYMSEFLCPYGPPCPVEVDGIVPRPDGIHFHEPAGARWAAERLVPRILAPMLPGAPPAYTYMGVGRV